VNTCTRFPLSAGQGADAGRWIAAKSLRGAAIHDLGGDVINLATSTPVKGIYRPVGAHL
jgi:hypothetical protein